MPELCPGQSGREDRNDAGRNAYLAAFHAAQAFIFERTGRVAKTHQGVRVEFNRLAKGEMRIDRERQRFLAQAYNLKSVADYEMGPEAVVQLKRAAVAIESAERFVESIAELCSAGGVDNS